MDAEQSGYSQQVKVTFGGVAEGAENPPPKGSRLRWLGRLILGLPSALTAFRKIVLDLTAVSLPFLVVAFFIGLLATDAVTIGSPSVPKLVQERGITPELLSQMLRARIEDIHRAAESSKTPELTDWELGRLVTSGGQEPLSIETGGLRLSLMKLAQFAANLLGMETKRHLSIGVLCKSTGCDGESLSLHAVAHSDGVSAADPVALDPGALHHAVDAAARHLLLTFDPYLLAIYDYNAKEDVKSARSIAVAMIREGHEQAVWAHNLLGIIAMNNGTRASAGRRYEQALEHFERALAIDGNFVAALVNKGNLLARQERFGPAIELFDQALELDGNFAATYSNYGSVLLRLCSWEAAVVAYEKALEIDSNQVSAILGRARVKAMREGDYTEMTSAHERVLVVDPTFETKLVGLQEILDFEADRSRMLAACETNGAAGVAGKLTDPQSRSSLAEKP